MEFIIGNTIYRAFLNDFSLRFIERETFFFLPPWNSMFSHKIRGKFHIGSILFLFSVQSRTRGLPSRLIASQIYILFLPQHALHGHAIFHRARSSFQFRIQCTYVHVLVFIQWKLEKSFENSILRVNSNTSSYSLECLYTIACEWLIDLTPVQVWMGMTYLQLEWIQP